MRVAPIGLVYHFDLNLVARYAELQSLPTHTAPSARAGAIALAVGVALGLMGFPRFKVWEIATDFAWRTDRAFSSKLKMIKELLSEDPKDAMEAIGTSPAVDEAVPAAFYCYLCFEPPEDALVQAASHGGDTDSIASMAGALLGAAKGPSWIPQKWLDPLEGRKKLEMTAEALENLSSQINERRRGDFI
jgi:ADP-ribosylglycohydrolase